MIEVMNDPGPIQCLSQRTNPRRRRPVWPIIAWTLTAILWGLVVLLVGVALGLYVVW